MKKGQFIRLFLQSEGSDKMPIAAATNLTFHISAETENSTTKDSDDADWDEYEVTGLSFDFTTDALVTTDDTGVNLLQQMLNVVRRDEEAVNDEIDFDIAYAEGEKNRTEGTALFWGSCKMSQLEITAQNRQNSTYRAQFRGVRKLHASPSTKMRNIAGNSGKIVSGDVTGGTVSDSQRVGATLISDIVEQAGTTGAVLDEGGITQLYQKILAGTNTASDHSAVLSAFNSSLRSIGYKAAVMATSGKLSQLAMVEKTDDTEIMYDPDRPLNLGN